MQWGLVFLLGGGFALAAAGKESGMSAMVGSSLGVLSAFPPLLVLFIACLTCAVLTEFSKVPIPNIVLPVLAEMSRTMKIHPLYFMLPATLMCSMTFHFPFSTPPNALVTDLVNIRTKDLALAGIGPSIITLLLIWGSFPTYGALIYTDLGTFPEWAKNNTTEIIIKFKIENVP